MTLKPENEFSTMIQKINISADLNKESIHELGRKAPYWKFVNFPIEISEEVKLEENNMTPENFCYWLQGFFEVGRPESLTKEQIEEIKNHLSLVFHKVTPQINIIPPWVNPDNPPFSTISKKYCEDTNRYPTYNVDNLAQIPPTINDIPTVVYPDGPCPSC